MSVQDLPPDEGTDINMDDEGNEIFEGGGEEMDPLPINISTEEMQELTEAGETVVVVELEDDMVPVRLVVQDVEDGELPPAEGPEGVEGMRQMEQIAPEELQIAEPPQEGAGELGMDEPGAV